MRKIKVAFFAEILHEDKDGASRTMFQLIKRIPFDRFEFMFIYGDGPDQLLDFPSLKVPTITIPSNKNYTLSIPSLIKRRLIRKLDTFGPDIVHIATPSLLGHFAVTYASKRHIPVVSIYHTHFISYIDYYLKHLPFLIGPVKRYVSSKKKLFYNQCDCIYVPTRTIKQELINYGIQASKMLLWERGIDNTLFNPLKKDLAKLEKITGNQQPTLLFVSRLVWEKNLEMLFKIYRLIKIRGIACNFLVVGDGSARKACESNMPGAIFLGHVGHDELASLYASSSIFVFPSVSETYGNVILEAQASGLPCVIADGGGSKDLIENGVNGFACNPNSEGEFVDRIETLLNKKTIHRQFSMLGIQESTKRNWERLADIYFNDIEQLGKVPSIYKLTS
ncbi:glycosyltransferase family 1 protein [Olivibacter sp. SA151]|uniref:glycosyltransferase family 4 protein n=1 Tax=Olivibacter jilunii TaxID=985016 RepID=UPI003F185365